MTTTYEYQGQAGGLYELKLHGQHLGSNGKRESAYEFWYDGVMLISGNGLTIYEDSEGHELAADCIDSLTSDGGDGMVLHLDSDGADEDMTDWIAKLREKANAAQTQ